MTTKEKIAYWEPLTAAIVADYQRLSRACETATAVGCMDINGPLHEAIWHTFDSLLARLDRCGWIAWFLHDNQCGKKALRAGPAGKTFPIRTPRQLARLLAAEGPPPL